MFHVKQNVNFSTICLKLVEKFLFLPSDSEVEYFIMTFNNITHCRSIVFY